jgi:hypothetical protein
MPRPKIFGALANGLRGGLAAHLGAIALVRSHSFLSMSPAEIDGHDGGTAALRDVLPLTYNMLSRFGQAATGPRGGRDGTNCGLAQRTRHVRVRSALCREPD